MKKTAYVYTIVLAVAALLLITIIIVPHVDADHPVNPVKNSAAPSTEAPRSVDRNTLLIKDKVPRKPVPVTKKIMNFPVISQMPELARGCEVTVLAMLIQSSGKAVDKMTLADQIEKVPFRDGVYRGNPNKGFVGNIETFDESGYAVYHGPVYNLARQYMDAVDLTGRPWLDVEKKIVAGKPVWVIVTSTFRPLPEEEWETWQTKDGPVKITYREHAVLVTGFDPDSVYVNDPLDGKKNKKLDRKAFIQGWEQFGGQAITY